MKHLRWIVLGTLVAAAGCGDDGGGSDGPPSDSQIGSLSQDQLDTLCMNVQSELAGVISGEQFCELTAVLSTMEPVGDGMTSTCEAAAQQCIGTDAGTSVPGMDMDMDTCPMTSDAEIMGCSVTVGEARTCQSDLVAQIQSALDSVSCDDVAGGVTALSQIGQTPESCQALQNNCEGLIPDLDPTM